MKGMAISVLWNLLGLLCVAGGLFIGALAIFGAAHWFGFSFLAVVAFYSVEALGWLRKKSP
jgi:hypothetical protein